MPTRPNCSYGRKKVVKSITMGCGGIIRARGLSGCRKMTGSNRLRKAWTAGWLAAVL